MTTGEQIALQRKRKGITQETLSETSGISLRTIQRIEGGQSRPRAYTLKILADQLGVSFDKLTEPGHLPEVIIPDMKATSLIQRMNSAGLTVVLLPFMPLFISCLLWAGNKKSGVIDHMGKRIISFQIIWLVLTLFTLTATKIIYYYLTGAHVVGHLSPLLPAYLLMLVLNLIIVILSAPKLQRQDPGIYRFIPPLF